MRNKVQKHANAVSNSLIVPLSNKVVQYAELGKYVGCPEKLR